MRRADQVIGSAMTAGFPEAALPSICANALENMEDWYCSTASSSQMPASASCSRLRWSGAAQRSSATAALLRQAAPPLVATLSVIRRHSLHAMA